MSLLGTPEAYEALRHRCPLAGSRKVCMTRQDSTHQACVWARADKRETVNTRGSGAGKAGRKAEEKSRCTPAKHRVPLEDQKLARVQKIK